MPVVSSSILEDRPQRDGRRSVRERHTDHAGRTHDVTYLAEPGDDVETVMLARVPSVNTSLAEAEFSRLLSHTLGGGTLLTFPFVDLTPQEGSRRLLRLLVSLEDPRPAAAYAQRVVAAGVAVVSATLGVSGEAAEGVIAWAQGVVDSMAQQDAARLRAAQAATELGG